MKKKIVSVLVSSVMVMMLCIGFTVSVSAAENQNGGQVTTEGIITFYENKTESTPSELPPTTTSSTESKIMKPLGKLPSTGEMIKGAFSIIGFALIICVFFFFFWKRKKEKEADQ